MPRHDTLLSISNKPASKVTDADVETVISTLKGDARVSHLEFAGRDDNGRPMISVRATDTRDGNVSGTYSVGRVISLLSETQAEHEERLLRLEEERVRDALAVVAREAETAARKAANRALLTQAGHTLQDLARGIDRVQAGRHIDWDTRVGKAVAWHFETVARDRSGPLALENFY